MKKQLHLFALFDGGSDVRKAGGQGKSHLVIAVHECEAIPGLNRGLEGRLFGFEKICKTSIASRFIHFVGRQFIKRKYFAKILTSLRERQSRSSQSIMAKGFNKN